MNEIPLILERSETRLSPWSSVTERTILMPGEEVAQRYHSLSQADYVSVVALTEDGRIPLVRQFRPALERFTLELPGGLRDANEDPEASAMRELFEETGLKAVGDAIMLGNLAPDAGRLENRLWGFAVTVKSFPDEEWLAEPGLEPLLVDPTELRQWILNGRFDHAPHIALIGMAGMHGFLKAYSEL
jgi:8-oxo-dGTP pyrophosphatase MutT (NUDIX family)